MDCGAAVGLRGEGGGCETVLFRNRSALTALKSSLESTHKLCMLIVSTLGSQANFLPAQLGGK